MTLKAPDADTILRYVGSKPGFVVIVDDGLYGSFPPAARIGRVLRQAPSQRNSSSVPEPGPLGMTVKSTDGETLDAYLRGVD